MPPAKQPATRKNRIRDTKSALAQPITGPRQSDGTKSADEFLQQASGHELVRLVAELMKPPISFGNFVEEVAGFKLEPWQWHLCNRLERLTEQKGQRILIHKPPRFGGSTIVSQYLPAYLMGRDPMHTFREVTHNQEHSEDFSDTVQAVLYGPEYQAIFPGTRIPKQTNLTEWSTTRRQQERRKDPQPSYRAIGIAGSGTGIGGKCFVFDTVVETESGPMDIGVLHFMAHPPRVLAFNHATGKTEYCRIVASKESTSSRLVRVTTADGRSFTSTPDHRVFSRGSYTEANHLREGDTLTTADYGMPRMRWGKIDSNLLLPEVLSSISKDHNNPYLQSLPKELFAQERRLPEAPKGIQRRLLLENMFRFGILDQVRKTDVSSLWNSYYQKARIILLCTLQRATRKGTSGKEKSNSRDQMPSLPDTVRSTKRAKIPLGLLLSNLRGQGAFRTHEGTEKPSLSNGKELHDGISIDETSHLRERWKSVCGLPYEFSDRINQEYPHTYQDESSNSSHRCRYDEQFTGESGNSLQKLPPRTPPVGEDSVSLVKQICVGEVKVYDIQVEGCSNFFAGEILVHNCWVVDDPYGSPKDAHSQAVNTDIRRWHRELLIPRLTPESNLIIMYHRFHSDDYAGWLEAQGGWEILRYAALADNEDPPDPLHRMIDEPLAPNRFPWEFMNAMRERDPVTFYNLYQGKPENPEGNAVKRTWFPIQHDYDVQEDKEHGKIPAFDPKILMGAAIYFDVGASSKGDETVGTLGCAMPDESWTWLWQITGTWNPAERDEKIVEFCQLVAGHMRFIAYLEEGIGLGRETVKRIVMKIRAKGIPADTIPSVGSKWERANNRQDSFRSSAQAGRIRLYDGDYLKGIGLVHGRASWIDPYLREVTQLQIKSTDHGVKLVGKDNKWDSGTGLHNALQKLSTPMLTLDQKIAIGRRFRR